MTFEQILVFHQIVRSGSFKSAAFELRKTQPAISFSVKKLEEEMEVELFDRSGYRPVLTAHGKSFFERSLKVVSGMHELDGLGKSFRNQEEPEVSVSVDGIYLSPHMLKLFKNFADKNTSTKLNLSFDILSETERRVLNLESQIGITHFTSDHQSLEIIPIHTVRMVPVMSRELFEERDVRLQSQLLDIDQIVVGDKNGPSGATFGLLDQGKKWRLMDSNFKREIIVAGLGWGHLSEVSIERELKENKLVVLEFADIHPRVLDINLIRLKKMQLGPVAKRLWDELMSFHL